MTEPLTAQELQELVAKQAEIIKQLADKQCKCRPAIFADIPAQYDGNR